MSVVATVATAAVAPMPIDSVTANPRTGPAPMANRSAAAISVVRLLSMMVVSAAVVLPMVTDANIDLLWFGIYVVIVVEMAQITPPIGFNLFVLQGMTHHQMNYIARAALPMFLIMVVMVFILIFFPDLATYLPENMRQTPGG